MPRRVSRRSPLEQATKALLDAWDARAVGGDDDIVSTLNGHVAALRVALTATASGFASNTGQQPPKDTKQAQVLTMLRRNEGASGPQIAEATGWASHTVRGFLAGLAKKGIQVEVLERVRQIDSDNRGTKGSYTVYRIADASEQ
jgi:biotin operon repressor